GDRVAWARDRLDGGQRGGRRSAVRRQHLLQLTEVEGLGERHPDRGVAGGVPVGVVVPLLTDQGRRLGREQPRLVQAGGVRPEDLCRVQATREQQVRRGA